MVSPEKRTENATNEHRSLTKRQTPANPVGALAVLKIACPLGIKLGKIATLPTGPLVVIVWPLAAALTKLTTCIPLAAAAGK